MSARTFWLGSMTKTARTVAVSDAPGCMRPYFCATFVSRSATTGKSILTPKCPSMFLIQAMCAGTESTESPMSCAPRSLNSSERRANSTNSVVQTGVKSAGCEKSTTHLPFMSESFSWPCVDLASKSGAGSLMRGRLPAVSGVADVLMVFQTPLSCGDLRVVNLRQALSENRARPRRGGARKLRTHGFLLGASLHQIASISTAGRRWKVLRRDERCEAG